jgi:hypothetical protein
MQRLYEQKTDHSQSLDGGAVNGTDLLARLREWGSVSLHDGRIQAEAETPPPEELRILVDEHRDRLKAAMLLSDPPGWLLELFGRYRTGPETPVHRTGATGKSEVFMVSVSIKNICGAVAAEIRMPVTEWERIRGEVEESLGAREGKA